MSDIFQPTVQGLMEIDEIGVEDIQIPAALTTKGEFEDSEEGLVVFEQIVEGWNMAWTDNGPRPGDRNGNGRGQGFLILGLLLG